MIIWFFSLTLHIWKMVYIDKIKKKMSEHDGTKLNKIKIIFQIKKKNKKKRWVVVGLDSPAGSPFNYQNDW
jgi:hypothetical protein